MSNDALEAEAAALWSQLGGDLERLGRLHHALSALTGEAPDPDRFFEGRPAPIDIDTVLIAPGEYSMGGRLEREQPAHEVRLSEPFRLAVTPVTSEQLAAFAGKRESRFSAGRPATKVSWWAARVFAHWLGGRLPTEAEWEYACRAGADGEWCFGDDEAQLTDFAWYAANALGTTHSVARKAANAFGLHDMHGNVLEWCDDWFGDYPAGPVTDPVGPANGTRRVLRGGAHRASAQACRSAYRSRFDPPVREAFIGFRVVLPAV